MPRIVWVRQPFTGVGSAFPNQQISIDQKMSSVVISIQQLPSRAELAGEGQCDRSVRVHLRSYQKSRVGNADRSGGKKRGAG